MRQSRRMRGSSGFTLIELILVVVIIGILAGIVVTSMSGRSEEARKAAAKSQITNFETALDLYEADNGVYPTTAQGLSALREEPSPKPRNWKGPYLKKDLPMDPWGKPYQYKAPGSHHPQGCDIWTMGPDGLDGTEDDIGNWNLQDQPKK